MYATNRSLRLCEILEEEFELLHGESLPSRTDLTDAIQTVELLNSTELIDRLSEHRKPEPDVKSAGASGSTTQKPTSTAGRIRVTLPTDVRYEKLSEWLRDTNSDADSLRGDELLALIKDTLEEKLNQDNQDFAKNESWMRGASLRSHTRGLLKRYDDQHALRTRVQSKISHLMPHHGEPSTSAPTDVADVPQENELQLLNRLLLEDAFVGYVKRFDDTRLAKIFSRMYDSRQSALCVSGGGIRSATFGLGVLQGLAKHSVLDLFTYLSTVSGGGYLGSWLSAWIHHEGIGEVAKQLNGHAGKPLEPEPVPLRHLRQYSNYLSPRAGLFSTDTWTLIMTYLRNLLLLWIVILPLLGAMTAIPWLGVTFNSLAWGTPTIRAATALALAIVAALLAVVGTAYVHAARPQAETSDSGKSIFKFKRGQSTFLRWCFLPLSLSMLFWTVAWQLFKESGPALPALRGFYDSFAFNPSDPSAVFGGTGWLRVMGGMGIINLVGWGIGVWFRSQAKRGLFRWLEPLVVVLTGSTAGFLFLSVIKLLHVLAGSVSPIREFQAGLYTCLAFPGVLLALLLTGSLFEGITSRYADDAEREWSARYGAWFLIASAGWLFINGLVLFGPIAVGQLAGWASTATVGLGSGILTALLGQSSKTGGSPRGGDATSVSKPNLSVGAILARLTLPVAAFIALVALLITLSFFTMWLMRLLCVAYGECSAGTGTFEVTKLTAVNPAIPFAVLAGLFVVGLVSGWFINTNKFSLHAMYRSRLIRAYLGASRPPGERQPDPFTGFDQTDNLYMGCVRPPESGRKVPFHIVNLALNLVAGRNLAWQERKAESFTVSPRHAGAMHLGYRRTYLKETRGCPKPVENVNYYGGDSGITLGTAMTISGAAASPNHGYNSSPLVAFLMTLFNLRLGWWLGNPGPAGDKTFNKSSPTSIIQPIIDEMTGNTDDVNEYVYLSDGGHFENLGLYEMALRRNRFILVSDAGCDETCGLEDLGNAIRKIRIDLGIAIDFPLGFHIRARSDTSPGSAKYWAIGRIRYPSAGLSVPDATTADSTPYSTNDGILLYVKPSIIGDEPRDVFNYASTKKSFPHESTGDQFFTESQFESYRALGAHALERVQADLGKELGISINDFFDQSKEQAKWRNCVDALNKRFQAIRDGDERKISAKPKGTNGQVETAGNVSAV